MQLLVNNTREFQEVITIDQSGGYFDESRVVWDERKHGPLPEFSGQGQERYTLDGSPALRVNQDLKTQQDAAKASWDAKVAREALKQKLKRCADLGRDVVMECAAINVEKEMTESERAAFAATFATAKSLLEQGLLAEAKTNIQALDLPIGYTESDRSEIIAKIDEAISASA